MAYYEKEVYEVLDHIPASYKKKSLGRGCHGECFLTEDGLAYKELDNGVKYPEDLRGLTTVTSEFFAFPKKIIYLGTRSDDTLQGYLCDYVEGIDFRQIPSDTSIIDIIRASEHFEKGMAEVTMHKGVVVDDLDNNGNVLYLPEKKEFKAIDTEQYECFSLEEYRTNMKKNLRQWARFILYGLHMTPYSFNNETLNLHLEMATYYGRFRPSIFLYDVLDEIRNEICDSVETLEDYEEGIKLIKRK